MMKNKIRIFIAILILNLTITLWHGQGMNCYGGIIGNDTTIVAMTNAPIINGVTDYTAKVVFPDSSRKYEQIMMNFTLSKPAAGWDPYDRVGHVYATKNGQTIEIGRIMTPFSKAYTWTIDVTDFRPVLTDSSEINANILYYVTAGSQQGYLVSVTFDFIGGVPKKEAYKIQNLWCNWEDKNRWEYGSDIHKISDSIPPKFVNIDPNADSIAVNVNCTGHGQFNTDNCAEFCEKTHSLRVDSNASATFSHHLWRNDCATNPCHPQSGTWQYDRAGWCPGSDVRPWKVDITQFAKGHNTVWLEYLPEEYHNFCSPDDTACAKNVAGSCNPFYSAYGSGCNYTNGHTMEFLLVQSQIIYYKNLPWHDRVADYSHPLYFSVFPNPSYDGKFTIDIRNTGNFDVKEIKVMNTFGEIIYLLTPNSQLRTINIDLSNQPGGVYFVKISTKKGEIGKKVILLH
jgi:hypothetical protein